LAGGSGRYGSIGVVEETYIAIVEVEGSLGVQPVDARPSDALNLAALVQAPILVAPEVLQEAEARREGDPPRQRACVGRWSPRR
jgi:bifunctional DNase/RNase